MGMKKNNEIILNKLMKNLNFYDIIMMKIFKSYTKSKTWEKIKKQKSLKVGCSMENKENKKKKSVALLTLRL